MFADLYRQLLATTYVWGVVCLVVLVIGLLWLRRSIEGARAGSSSYLQNASPGRW